MDSGLSEGAANRMNLDTDNLNARQIALLDELRRTERQVAMFYVASMIVHSVGTPLNVVVGRAGMIHRDSNATEAVADNAKAIERKVEQLATKLRSLVEFLSLPDLQSTAFDTNVLLDDTLSLYMPVARMRNVVLSSRREPNLPGVVERNLAFVILSSLVSLVVNDVEPGSTIEILVQSMDGEVANGPEPGFVKFQLGVPGSFPDPRALERFEFPPSTDAQCVNRMQVLATCLATVRRVGGKIELETTAQNLTLISILWPAAA